MNTTGQWQTIAPIRKMESLGGLWDFVFLGEVAISSVKVADSHHWEKMPVPSAFDAMPAYAGKRGAAIYKTQFCLDPNQRGLLEFGAVSMWCRVYVDGEMLTEHACGYSPFVVEIPPSEREYRELSILVDNRFDFSRVPMHEAYFDFYQYGGILRDVTLIHMPRADFYMDSLEVIPTDNYKDGEVEVRVNLRGSVSKHVKLDIRFDHGDESSWAPEVSDEGTVKCRLRVPNPKLWSPLSPHLHEIRVRLLDENNRGTDDVTARFGLRRIESIKGALWLNGEKLKLHGYNRHEWHPNYGPCTPILQMVADLQLMKGIGCNFVRGSHYPQDQRFLDLCDEMGFLVWEENLGWGQREKTFADAKFRADHAQSLREMVRASINHPSIIIWGFLNEAGSNEAYTRPIFEETVDTLRKIDPSRLISYASMFPEDDKHFDLVDIISLNLYPGWYNCEEEPKPLDLIKPFIDKCIAGVDAAGWKEKPVIISEIGAEGLYGWHDPHNDFYTEEYQAEYLKRACESALRHSRCSGIAIWHFSDVRTYGGGRSMKRPRTFNNKGSFDEYRRPKASCKVVGEIFRRENVL